METLNIIYYSPTRTTQNIVKTIGQELGLKLLEEYSITSKLIDFKPALNDNCLTIIGMPTYGGRLPIEAVEKLKKLQSKNTPAVIVVVYGNRAYDDALLELKMLVENCGFKIIAAAAFIGEHSYSSIDKPIAMGRPDELDLIKCIEFSQKIKAKMIDLKIEDVVDLNIPGTYPHKERSKRPDSICPETDYDKCDNCGICVDVCPSNAITINGQVITNAELCTWCCACVKSCPTGARIFENPTIDAIKERLFTMCSERREPEFFV
jgi:ferredoxin/flavodoxin